MPMRALVWLLKNFCLSDWHAPPWLRVATSQHRRHLFQVRYATFWPVAQKPLDGLGILSKKGNKNVLAFD